MISAIDTNILLDILIPDERYAESSKNLIDKYKEKEKLQICEIVYSELVSQFPLSDELELFLQDTGINLEHSNRKALSIAGERWENTQQGDLNYYSAQYAVKNYLLNARNAEI